MDTPTRGMVLAGVLVSRMTKAMLGPYWPPYDSPVTQNGAPLTSEKTRKNCLVRGS